MFQENFFKKASALCKLAAPFVISLRAFVKIKHAVTSDANSNYKVCTVNWLYRFDAAWWFAEVLTSVVTVTRSAPAYFYRLVVLLFFCLALFPIFPLSLCLILSILWNLCFLIVLSFRLLLVPLVLLPILVVPASVPGASGSLCAPTGYLCS